MNTKRILIAGVVAGVVLNVVLALPLPILGARMAAAVADGVYNKEPRVMFLPLWPLLLVAVGVGLAWLYAVARTRLGPGPKTAATVGLVAGLLMHVPPNFSNAAWVAAGRFIPMVWMIAGVLSVVAATVVAGALYKEEGA